MPIDITKSMQRAQKVKFPNGVVGKVCAVVVLCSVTVGTLAAITRNDKIIAATIGALLLFAFPLLWRVITFANKNPQAALLEGAEFLAHTQIVLGSKNNPTLQISDVKGVAGHAVNLTKEEALKPDETPKSLN